jgi:copper(I)-binding protein
VWRFFRAPNPEIRQGEYDAVSRNSRRAAAIAVAGVFAVAPLVSACAAGQHPQSALPTQLAEGVNASARLVDVRNTFVLGPQSGQKLAAGASAPLYAWFVNRAASPDRLVAVEAPGVAQSVEIAGGALDLPPSKLINTVEPPAAAPATPTASASPTATPTPKTSRPAKPGRTPAKPRTPGATGATGATGSTGTPGAPATGTPAAPPATSSKLILKGLTKAYSGGETVRLTLRFQRAGAVTLNVPVVPRDGAYATYSPAPAPAPTPSATPLPTPQKKTTTPPKSTGKSRSRAGKAKKTSATPAA